MTKKQRYKAHTKAHICISTQSQQYLLMLLNASGSGAKCQCSKQPVIVNKSTLSQSSNSSSVVCHRPLVHRPLVHYLYTPLSTNEEEEEEEEEDGLCIGSSTEISDHW